MGTNFLGHCETCCGKDTHEIESDKNPILIKKSTRFSPVNQDKYMKKILISSSPTNFNYYSSSAISDRTDCSISLDNSPTKSFKNDIINLQNKLINPQMYEKMIKGERLHNLLEPLTYCNNNILYELLFSISVKIKHVFKDSFFDEKEVINLHKICIKTFEDLYNDGIIEDIRANIEEDSRIKYNLMDVIESIVELFHFFKYKILSDQEPYNKFYWEQYKDYINYMRQKLNEIKNGIININLSLGDNKLKIIE